MKTFITIFALIFLSACSDSGDQGKVERKKNTTVSAPEASGKKSQSEGLNTMFGNLKSSKVVKQPAQEKK